PMVNWWPRVAISGSPSARHRLVAAHRQPTMRHRWINASSGGTFTYESHGLDWAPVWPTHRHSTPAHPRSRRQEELALPVRLWHRETLPDYRSRPRPCAQLWLPEPPEPDRPAVRLSHGHGGGPSTKYPAVLALPLPVRTRRHRGNLASSQPPK